jgi:two-component system chemotaxis response regulator CheB
MLTKIISGDAELEVVGVAASASIGLQKIEQCSPDIVVLDVEMEEMNGIEMAGAARKRWPRLPILMCSTLTERGADATIAALAAGASDYITKPRGDHGVDAFRDELLRKLKLLSRPLATAAPAPLAQRPLGAAPLARPPAPREPPAVLLIGCSTGGPNALAQVFAGFKAPPAVPILIVQHMPPLFTRMLAERLSKTTAIPTSEGADGMTVRPGHAYIAPGDYHMVVRRRGFDVEIGLNQEPPESSCRPAVDPLFRSAVAVYRASILAGVLTGMGRDGALGARAVVDAGGRVFVQDAASCVVPSMPMSVLDAGVPAEIVPLDGVASFLTSSLAKARCAS